MIKHAGLHPGCPPQVMPTTERIDMEKLKAREQIMFFEEVLLFEDELHDHGVSMISVKIVSRPHPPLFKQGHFGSQKTNIKIKVLFVTNILFVRLVRCTCQ